METEAEYEVSSDSDMPMHAYVVMLHLVSKGYTNFVEMRKVLCRETPGSYYIVILAYIVKKIEQLEEEWGEDIPPITALVFKEDSSVSEWACERLTGNPKKQPTPQQIEKLKADVAAYDKWDKVLEALRPLSVSS